MADNVLVGFRNIWCKKQGPTKCCMVLYPQANIPLKHLRTYVLWETLGRLFTLVVLNNTYHYLLWQLPHMDQCRIKHTFGK